MTYLRRYDMSHIDNGDSPVTAEAATFYCCDISGGSITINLPATAGKAGHRVGAKITNFGVANTVTLDADGSETIDGAGTKVLSVLYDQVELLAGDGVWMII